MTKVLRRVLVLLTIVGLSFTATTCLNDNLSGPQASAVRLSIAAQIAGQIQDEWTVSIRVYYVRTNDQEIDLPVSPSQVTLDAGTTTSRDIAVQVGACLADPDRVNSGEGGCALIVELKLLDESGEPLVQSNQVVRVEGPGEVVEAPPFNLAGSFMIFSPTSASFNAVQGSALPAQSVIGVSSSTGASLGTLSTNITYQSGSGWLTTTPSPSQIAVRPNTTSLSPGTYQATVLVIPANKDFPDRSFAVTYVVSSASTTGSISGVVRNSQTALPLPGATLELRAGANNTTGTPLTTTVANNSGQYVFTSVASGTYTIVAKLQGFVDGSRGSIVVAGAPVTEQDIIMSPPLQGGQTRIVLTWGNLPGDLDSHLTGPNGDGGQIHICWANEGSAANFPFVALDIDDTNGNGPETTTIYSQVAGTYRFYVFDYTNTHGLPSTPLASSGARVQVFRGTSLISDFAVPSGTGNLWTVFTLNGTTVTPVNTLTTTAVVPGSSCGTLPSQLPSAEASFQLLPNAAGQGSGKTKPPFFR